MKVFILALIFMLGGIGLAKAQEMCFTPSAEQVEAAQYFKNQWNTIAENDGICESNICVKGAIDDACVADSDCNTPGYIPLTVKQYVKMRLISSQHSSGVFNKWIREMNNEKAKKINLKDAYKRSPDSVKDQIKTLLEPYKDG